MGFLVDGPGQVVVESSRRVDAAEDYKHTDCSPLISIRSLPTTAPPCCDSPQMT